jgi:hypothetical protein
MVDGKIQKVTNTDLVPMAYYDMFALRILGATYEQIAEKTSYNPSYVRRLFCSGGSLHELYRNWVENKKKENIVEVYDIILGNLPDIIRARAIHAKTLAKGAVESSKLLLGYVLGDPSASQTNVQINNVAVEPERKELIMNAFRNFGLIKEEKNDTSKPNINKRAGRSNNRRPVAKKGKR